MRRVVLTLVLAALASTLPAAVLAQQEDFQIPEYTEQQRWNRLASGMVYFQAALLELGMQHGMTAEEVGGFVGDVFARSWVTGADAAQFMVNFNRNYDAFPGAESELLDSSADEVTARFNRPWEAWVGLDRQIIGITSDEFLDLHRGLTLRLSEHVGIATTWTDERDHHVVSFRTEYAPIGADDNLRYGRLAYLSWLTSLQLLDMQMKETGLSARELGLQQGEMYAPSWTSRTPWQLFRGMVWNGLAHDRTMDCEVLSASPQEVRARCTHTFEQRIGQGANYFDVTVEDFLENIRGFGEAVAEARGMVWEERWEPGVRVIRVSVR